MIDPRLGALHDIQPAPEPTWWPPGPAWWLLGLLMLVALVVAGWYLWHGWRRLRLRRRVLQELHQQIRTYADQPRELAGAVSVLLRRAALQRFPPEQVAGLSGTDWLRFLERTGGRGFIDGPGRVLAEAPYRPGVPLDVTGLHQLARHWLRCNL
jgi:hypothetical protein